MSIGSYLVLMTRVVGVLILQFVTLWLEKCDHVQHWFPEFPRMKLPLQCGGELYKAILVAYVIP